MKNRYRIIVPLLLCPLHLYAFTLLSAGGYAFNKNEVSINVASPACENIGLTNNELLDLAFEAMEEYWNRAPTSRLKIVKGSVLEKSSAFREESLCETGTDCIPNGNLATDDIVITCNINAENFSVLGILGLTAVTKTDGPYLAGSVVAINDNDGNYFAKRTRAEQKAIIAHEVGHAIGLGHSSVQDSLMYYSDAPERESLGEDDIDGVAFLYPREQPFGSSCGSIEFIQQGPKKGQHMVAFLMAFLLGALLTGVSKKRARP